MTTTSLDHSPSLTLDYQLTEGDVHRYCVFSRPRKCWRSCRKRKAGWLILVLLGSLLVGICSQRHGIRAGLLVVGTSLAVLASLAWSHQAFADRHVCRLAGQMGLPLDLQLIISPEGISEKPELGTSHLDRAFRWSEVVEIRRVDGVTVIQFKPGGGVLIIPDRAFPNPKAQKEFGNLIRSYRENEMRRLSEPVRKNLRS